MASSSFTIDRAATDAFARLSGDANPLHVDPVVARRSVYGRCVIHGVHVLLRALEGRPPIVGRQSIVELRARFLRPAFHGALLSAEYAGSGELKVLDESGATLVSATILEEPASTPEVAVAGAAYGRGAAAPLKPADAQTYSVTEPLRLDPVLAAGLFPRLFESARHVQLAELLAATRVVGMQCPGLYSTLTGIQLRRSPGRDAATAGLRTINVHAHTGRLKLALEGPTLSGQIEAFFRPREVEQPSWAAVKAAVGPADMNGHQALVIGGSRGLGELAAKICAARGARVVITFKSGEADARRVCAEIAAGGGACEAVALDAAASAEKWALPAGFVPTDALFFATPHIGSRGATFETARFEEFCAVYVGGLVAVVDLAARLGSKSLDVFNPSTAFLDTGEGAPEYVAAKAAGEVVARWLSTRPGVRVHSFRLPPLATDETATFLATARTPALPALLQALRTPGNPS